MALVIVMVSKHTCANLIYCIYIQLTYIQYDLYGHRVGTINVKRTCKLILKLE